MGIRRSDIMKVQSINPANGEVNKELEAMTDRQALDVCKAAKAASRDWREMGIDERLSRIGQFGNVLRQNKKEYARLATVEMGRLLKDAEVEVERSAEHCDLLVSNAREWLKDEVVATEYSKSVIAFEPVGTVLMIMPWNFPYSQVTRTALPALTAGNTVVLRHSNSVPMVAQALEEAFRHAGFPENVFRSVITDHKAIAKMIRSRFIDAVAFTGSADTGKAVAKIAATGFKKCALELGGSNSFIVLRDVNLDVAAQQAVASRIPSCGQSCSASKRFIVVEEVADEFTRKVVENTKALVVGDPSDQGTHIGPLANSQQLEKLEAQVRLAVEQGAKLECGGKRYGMRGYFYQPTVLTGVKKSMAVMKEEVFGPVIPIIRVRNEEEALKLANASDFGLGGSVWTADVAKGEQIARKLNVGVTGVNRSSASDNRMPFGGMKKSGTGRDFSRYGMLEFVNIKSIMVK